MMLVDRLDPTLMNRFVLAKHHLADDSRSDDIVRIASDISGLHATGSKEPYLALLARTNHFTRKQLDDELYVRRSLVKMRCVRGTLYILTAEMAPVAYAATRAIFEKPSVRYAELNGISESEYADSSKQVMELLRGRLVTVAEIKRGLKTQVHFSALMNLMCDRGLLARVQQRDGWEKRTCRYAIFSEFFKGVDLGSMGEEEAITRLLESYLKSFGPATETDMAWWTGLGKGKIRQGLKRLESRTAYLSASGAGDGLIALKSDLGSMAGTATDGRTAVNLLPVLDPYIMGYKRRERYLGEKKAGNVFDRSGNATSTVMVDGRIAGVWDYSSRGRVGVLLFDKIGSETRERIAFEAGRMGEFVNGAGVKVDFVSSMTPLAQRTAGGFMSPLRETKEGVNP